MMNWMEILAKMRKEHVAARRKNWNGEKYIFYVPTTYIDGFDFKRYGFKGQAGLIDFVPCLLIHTKENTLGFYATTQCDMLADDWEVSV